MVQRENGEALKENSNEKEGHKKTSEGDKRAADKTNIWRQKNARFRTKYILSKKKKKR